MKKLKKGWVQGLVQEFLELYFRKIRPSTTCLYSAASTCPCSLSTAAQGFCPNPRLASLLCFAV